MRQEFVASNWKMYSTAAAARRLAKAEREIWKD